MQTTAHANDLNERSSISRSIRLDNDLESGTTGQGTLTRIPTQSHLIPATAMKNLRKLSVGTTCSERLPMTHHDPPSPKKHRNSMQIGAIECKSMQHHTITRSSFVNRRERLLSLRSQIPWNAYEHLRTPISSGVFAHPSGPFLSAAFSPAQKREAVGRADEGMIAVSKFSLHLCQR
jgi:hypothetical protein